MSPARLLLVLLPALVLLAVPAAPPVDADELVRVTARVSYAIDPDLGPIHVSWNVDLLNNDPRTAPQDGGVIAFYDSYPLPILRGATDISALSSSGTPLLVSQDDTSPGPLVTATVGFDRMLFYQDSYSFTLDYDLPSAREESLLVTPYYIFLPLIASGDDVAVSVSTPAPGSPWESVLEPVDCAQNGSAFTCSESKSVHLAAFAEVSRADATGNIALDLSLQQRDISLTITYFQGEETWAQHLQELLAPALPLIEGLYGFPYSGPFAVNVAERGRQVILGYEGLTSCDPQAACDVAVSPIADDYTVLHEIAHLWSDVYGRRWLAEGFAEFIAHEAADRLPPDLLQGSPPSRGPSDLDLRLDEWGDVTSIITASEEERRTEDAGYERSLEFLQLVEDAAGLQALQQTNAAIAAIAAAGQPADSRTFMDTLEDTSGQNLDQLFAQFVFPDSLRPTLDARRQARDRLAVLTGRAQAEGLSPDVPDAIRRDIAAWNFDPALAALDRAEAALATYTEVKDPLATLRTDVAAAGLPFPQSIDAAVSRWDFEAVRLSISAARQALDAYTVARAKVDEPRNLWERFGLLGGDPDGTLDDASRAFGRGDFQAAVDKANDAASAVDGASRSALIRLTIAMTVLAGLTVAVAAALWVSRRRSPGAPLP